MPAGELRERIRFERRIVNGDDTFGNVTYAWEAITADLGANLEPQGGTENADTQLLRPEHSFTITVRWSTEASRVMTNDRAVNTRTGETYDITSISNPDQRRRFIAMTATRGGAEA